MGEGILFELTLAGNGKGLPFVALKHRAKTGSREDCVDHPVLGS